MSRRLSSWKQFFLGHLRARITRDPEAQVFLAVLYATGEVLHLAGVDAWPEMKNEAKALQWYSAAAKQGHSEAQYNLGFMLLLGEGAPPDAQAALGWLERAAQAGSESAAKLLGDLYDGWGQERGVERNVQRAAYWRAQVAR